MPLNRNFLNPSLVHTRFLHQKVVSRNKPHSKLNSGEESEIRSWEYKRIISLHRPGSEPGPPAWQASILPLNQRCWVTLLPTKSICDGASLNVRDLLNVSKRVWMPRCGKEIWSQVPPRFELGSQDSESWVLTITPWNPTESVQGKLRKSIWWLMARCQKLSNYLIISLSCFLSHMSPLWSSG